MSFREDVRPILMKNCVQCHGGQLGLYVDTYDTLLAGSSNGRVVIPGDPRGSIPARRLTGELPARRLTGELQPRMPLAGTPLSDQEIAIVADWIREGAPND